jgi:hydroxymethylpyrimidine pyrophosphatase-like HAD family hydrolase
MNYIYVEPADKAKGIRKVMQIYGVKHEDVVVFGDERNDLSMFMPEWTCIAMGNGRDELKRKADFVTGDADKGGIRYALKHFGWI